MTLPHIHISAKHRMFDLHLDELWRYRLLLWLFTRRYFAVSYKQTILGPLWLFINPLLTSFFHIILFGNIAKLSTDGIPQLLFYFAGNTIWGYFSGSLSGNASVFLGNVHLFGKVYFPRLIMPLTTVTCAVVRMGIQMLFIFALIAYYLISGMIHPHWEYWFFLPVIVLQLGLLGMGLGLVVSSLTTRYRDLSVLVGFGLQLWMYATPVVYPLSTIPAKLRELIGWNPVTPVLELFRYALLGTGTIMPGMLAYSCAVTILILLAGIVAFNKMERTFMDTI